MHSAVLRSIVLALTTVTVCTAAVAGSVVPALNKALRADDVERAASLIDKGEALDSTDVWGYRPIHLAALRQHASIVEKLIEAGADVNAPLDSELDSPELSLRIRKARKLHYNEGIQGATALYLAAQVGRADIVRMLLDSGATIDSTTHAGDTPLLIAGAKGQVDVVRLLVTRGADLDHANAEGSTVLIYASLKGYGEIVAALIDGGTSVDQQNDGRNSALVLAARNGHESIVRMLLDAGANVNLAGAGGETALHNAAYFGRAAIVPILLDAGADVHLPTDESRTALHMAAWTHQIDTAEILLDAGAEPIILEESADDLYGTALSHKLAAARDGEAEKYGLAAEYFERAADGFDAGQDEVRAALRSKRTRRAWTFALGTLIAYAGARAQAQVSDIGQGVETVSVGSYNESELVQAKELLEQRAELSRSLAAECRALAGD